MNKLVRELPLLTTSVLSVLYIVNDSNVFLGLALLSMSIDLYFMKKVLKNSCWY